MQKYVKLCENMWKYAKVCIVKGYLASVPTIEPTVHCLGVDGLSVGQSRERRDHSWDILLIEMITLNMSPYWPSMGGAADFIGSF